MILHSTAQDVECSGVSAARYSLHKGDSGDCLGVYNL